MTLLSSVRRFAGPAAVAALLVLHYVMAIAGVSQKSMTFDEMAHLTGGYTYWAFNDYRLHPENGNWSQRLGALPAVLTGASFPRLDSPAWTRSDVYGIGDQFFYASGNDAGTMLRRGRAVMALLGVALGAIVYAWSRRLISPAAAWVSLVLFVFSPTLLAHGPLVTSDVAAALFFTTATGALWVAWHRVTPATVLGAAVLTAGCFLSKLSGPILVPIGIVMLAVRLTGRRSLAVRLSGRTLEIHGRVRQLALLLAVGMTIGLVAWIVIWASFGFRYTAFAAATTGKDAFLGQVTEHPGTMGWVLSTARRLHLLPEAYIYGLDLTVAFASERAAFLNGQFSTTGWWYFFPYAFAVKTTIPGMIVGLLAVAALWARWNGREHGETWPQNARASLYAATPLLALVLVYWAFAITTRLNIGHRHLLPTYPALCIMAGGAAFWIQSLFVRARPVEAPRGRHRHTRRAPDGAQRSGSGIRKAAGVTTLALLAWHVAESIAISPDYLAYFNQLAGGPSEGYKHLADSSLDWGQDLPALKEWLDRERLQQPAPTGLYLSYFGTARPEYYGVRATRLAGFIDQRPPEPPVPLVGGTYCVSATMLNVISQVFYRPEHERTYQAALQDLALLGRASDSEQAWSELMRQTGEEHWQRLFLQFDQLRTGRLLALLRRREPDALIGYSILVYRLTDADVEQALYGPVPSTADTVEPVALDVPSAAGLSQAGELDPEISGLEHVRPSVPGL